MSTELQKISLTKYQNQSKKKTDNLNLTVERHTSVLQSRTTSGSSWTLWLPRCLLMGAWSRLAALGLTIPEGVAGAGGYREHDILIITEDGAENITGYPYGPDFNVVG